MASQFGPERLEYTTGGPIANQPIYVRLRGSLALAELYADAAETAPADNPVMTDGSGDLVFFAEPGYYDLAFGSAEFPVIVGTPPGLPEVRAYTHVQSVAASEWLIVHNLGYKPAGLKVVINGVPAETGWHYSGDNIVVSLSQPDTGVAYVS